MPGKVENYDFFCVDYAKRLADAVSEEVRSRKVTPRDFEKAVTECLEVLEHDGVYAFLLYMTWREFSGTEVERRVYSKLDSLLVGKRGADSLLRLGEIGLPGAESPAPLDLGRELSEDLDSLLFAKDLLERTLIYARYHAKGMASEE